MKVSEKSLVMLPYSRPKSMPIFNVMKRWHHSLCLASFICDVIDLTIMRGMPPPRPRLWRHITMTPNMVIHLGPPYGSIPQFPPKLIVWYIICSIWDSSVFLFQFWHNLWSTWTFCDYKCLINQKGSFNVKRLSFKSVLCFNYHLSIFRHF